ncbi:cobalamin biosynthesis protein CbiX [Nocardioides sp. zg-DK7169]|uniref:cobalamin biosynthesis protein CbiX n=1 Tax=Nocardioides sp. zg-DK7169 TaxID=2736600 RepID=UPI00155370F5|nr:cobalamin biosynthesis protein CbiX [Nocardioides sp. zg-DK7169]NPC96662.1 cobalamin biosynthesis protein CbiX [Nocardioides sp. zg-DK7169]
MLLSGEPTPVTVLVGGHESADGADLVPLLDALPHAVVSPSGRALQDALGALLAAGGSAVVLPMTWGRDPSTVAETAKTLSWLASRGGAGRLSLCADFGTPDHLVSWLRRAATQTAAGRPGAGVVIAAAASNPFDDADLHRVAHLVRSHGAGVEVEVACLVDPGPDLARAVRRAQLLGSDDVVVVPAGFARNAPGGLPPAHASFFGPLLSERAVLDIVRRRVSEAQHAMSHGDDGIAAGLMADHGHGYAHSHDGEGGGHAHAHPHPGHDTPHETPRSRGTSPGEALSSSH